MRARAFDGLDHAWRAHGKNLKAATVLGVCFALASTMALDAFPAAATDAAPRVTAAVPSVSPTPQSLIGRAATPPSPAGCSWSPTRTGRAARDRLVRSSRRTAPTGWTSSHPKGSRGRLRPAHGTARSGRTRGHRGGARRHGRAGQGRGLRAARLARAGITLGGKDAAGQFYAVQTLRQLFVRSGTTAGRCREYASATSRRCRCGAPSRASTASPGPRPNASTRWTSTGTSRRTRTSTRPRTTPTTGIVARALSGRQAGGAGRAGGGEPQRTMCASPSPSPPGCRSATPTPPTARRSRTSSRPCTTSGPAPSPSRSTTSTTPTGTATADRDAYGEPGRGAAGRPRSTCSTTYSGTSSPPTTGTRPLQMVPTEYRDLTDTPYKQAMRATLWTPRSR